VPVWVVYFLVGNGYIPLFTLQVSWFQATLIFAPVFIGILIVAQIYRYRTVSTAVQRQQTKWIVFAGAISVVAYVVLTLPFLFNPALYPSNSPYALIAFNIFHFVELLGPISIYIAIVRYRLYDIDIIIRRTLVYGMLTACVVALYVLVVVGLGALLQSRGTLLISLLATCLVAVLFQPLRERLQRAVNRLIYGERDEPDKVISRLGQRLEGSMAPDAVLPTIVATVAQALKLPYAAITLKQEGEMVTAAAYGVPKEYLIHLPLVYHNEQLGEIVLAPRGPGESFTPADLALLEDLARQTGDAVHTVRLTTDLQSLTDELQASRTQLVTTREEERRRLRRDLHDGLGSALTSMAFQLDAASNVLERDPQAARTLLADLKRQTQAAIADIRRLVYNLRPPILDEWGLVAALREQVAQYQLDHVRVCVEAPESLPPLPAAVEVAAYRIALEALANVVRHAHASNCTMRLVLSDEVLNVEVRDDGEGLPEGYHAGVGISAMRERAAELGGSCAIETITVGGTRVSARLPLQN
jgi:signal transduction histidine kinase